MRTGWLFISLLWVGCAVESKQPQTVTDPEDCYESWQKPPETEKVNNDLTTGEITKTKAVPEAGETEPEVFQVKKSDWALSHPNSYFQSKYIDSIVREKNKNLIADDDNNNWNFQCDVFDRLSIRELTARQLIYYALAYPGSYSQSCVPFMWNQYEHPACIFPYMPQSDESRSLSSLQVEMLIANKDSVCAELSCYFAENDTVDLVFMEMVSEANLYGVLPTMVEKAHLRYNPLLYTFLDELLRKAPYHDLISAPWHKKLRERMSGLEPVELSKKEIRLLLERALQFHRGLSQQPGNV